MSPFSKTPDYMILCDDNISHGVYMYMCENRDKPADTRMHKSDYRKAG